MVTVTISVGKSKMKNLGQSMKDIKKKGLSYTGQGMIRNLQKNSPVDHGLLRKWYPASVTDDEIIIKTPAEYAKYVNDGTGIFGPHGTPITHPSIGKPFVFQVGGQLVLTRQIMGQKGQHFVEKSMEQTQAQLKHFYIKAIREVLG